MSVEVVANVDIGMFGSNDLGHAVVVESGRERFTVESRRSRKHTHVCPMTNGALDYDAQKESVGRVRVKDAANPLTR